jgi:hypothetical protein
MYVDQVCGYLSKIVNMVEGRGQHEPPENCYFCSTGGLRSF